MRKWPLYLSTFVGTFGALAVHGQVAAGQSVAPSAAPLDGSPGEIIVTAQRRAQRLSDVGITITAASGAQLQSAGVKDITDLPKIAPGVTTGYNYLGYAVFSVRGVNFNAGQLSAAPSVSVYLDEAILPYAPMTDGLLFDVERVEVIKGPQGTLFGQNATGGSINVIAAKPTSTWKAGLQSEVNNFGQVDLDGFVSGPISDAIRIRLAGMTTQFGAWQKGYYLTRGLGKNGEANRSAGRMILDWDATSRTKVELTLSGNYNHGEAQQSQLSQVATTSPAAAPGLIGYPLPTSDRDLDLTPGIDTHLHNRQYQGILRLTSELSDNLSLTSLTSYIDFHTRRELDADGVAQDISKVGLLGSDKTLSQEFRLNGKAASSKITYVVGVNYQHDKITDDQFSTFNQYSGLPPGTDLDSINAMRNRTIGAFGNVDWEFLPNLTLTTGLRYTASRERFTGCTFGNLQAAETAAFISSLLSGSAPPDGAFVPGGCVTINNVGPAPDYLPIITKITSNEHNLSWRAGLNYKLTSDDLIYVLASRGYKAGGYPVQTVLLASALGHVRQEKLTSYEVGAKLSFLDRKLQINGAVFYYDYINKQFFTYIPSPIGATSILTNIPRSKVEGAEFEIHARPFQGLSLNGGLTYVKTRVGNYQGFDVSLQSLNFKGNEFNFAPPLTATFDAEYQLPVSERLTGYVGGGGLYNSRTFADLANGPSSRLPAHTIVDARIGVRSRAGWQAGLWIRNLTNKYYWTTVAFGGDTLTRYAGMPRTFGGTFGVNF